MIYFVLDAEWDVSKDAVLGTYLSGANPFLFDDIGSADPSIYIDFCSKVKDEISIEESRKIAIDYLSGLKCKVLSDSFSTLNECEWIDSVKDYLKMPHKGSNND